MMTRDSRQWLLVTDVDDTLAGDWSSLREFAESCASVLLVLNSSRPRSSLAVTIAEFPDELRIDGVVSALGTEIEVGGKFCCKWQERFADWDRSLVDRILAEEGCEPHPHEMQTAFKASFAVPASRWSAVAEKIFQTVPGSRVITSGKSDFDVIPARADKGAAALHVAALLGIPRARMIVAGDSGNDLSMFQVADRAIAVGNARRELIDAADPARTYFARAPRAAGLIEGLLHWGALTPTHFSYG
jgi:hypothetical protein